MKRKITKLADGKQDDRSKAFTTSQISARLKTSSSREASLFERVISAAQSAPPDDATVQIERAKRLGLKTVTNFVTVPDVTTPFGIIPSGLYLMSGPPASRKSLTSLALVYWLLGSDVIARYEAISEPRAPRSDLEKEMHSLPTMLPNLFNTAIGPAKVVVIDSISLAMRSYVGTSVQRTKRGESGAMTGGMDVLDQYFCRHVQQEIRSVGVLVGIVGSTEVPFVEALEGLVEGIISANNPGSFTIAFRAQKNSVDLARAERTVAIPSWALELASQHLGYGSYIQSTSRSDSLLSR